MSCIAALQLQPKTSCLSSTPCIAALQALAEIVKACVQEAAKTCMATQAAADRIASAVRERWPQEGDDLQAALEMDQEPADIEDIRQYFDQHHMDKARCGTTGGRAGDDLVVGGPGARSGCTTEGDCCMAGPGRCASWGSAG